MEKDKEDFQSKIDLIFNESLTISHQFFILETKNRELVFSIMEEKIKDLLKKEKSIENYLSLNLKVFDVQKARALLSYGNVNYNKNYFFIISFYSIVHQAQNALLKFLEDTPSNVKVILIVHRGAELLDTLKSRSYKLEIPKEEILTEYGEEEFLLDIAEKFLATKKINRMKLKGIEEILKRKDEYALEFEDKERIDREILERFLLNLHKVLVKKFDNLILSSEDIASSHDSQISSVKNEKTEKDLSMHSFQTKESLSDLEKVIESIKYIKNHSSSGKTILEYLALSLAVIG